MAQDINQGTDTESNNIKKKGYIENNLISREVILARAKVSWWSQWTSVLFAIVVLPIVGIIIYLIPSINVGMFSLVILGTAILLLINAYIRIHFTETALTTHRIIHKTGWLDLKTLELNVRRIEGLAVNQSVFERIFGYGTVVITGTGGMVTPLRYISNPLAFRKAINEYLL